MVEGMSGRGRRIRSAMTAVVMATVGAVWTVLAEAPSQNPTIEATRHWAYRPVVKPSVPVLSPASQPRVRQPLDAFVLAALEARGLTLSERADRATLIRRAYFDLLGIPPSADEIKN